MLMVYRGDDFFDTKRICHNVLLKEREYNATANTHAITFIVIADIAYKILRKCLRCIKESQTEEGRTKHKLSYNYYQYKVKNIIDGIEGKTVSKALSNYLEMYVRFDDTTMLINGGVVDFASGILEQKLTNLECVVCKLLKDAGVKDNEFLALADISCRLLSSSTAYVRQFQSTYKKIKTDHFEVIPELYKAVLRMTDSLPIILNDGTRYKKSIIRITEKQQTRDAYKEIIESFYDDLFFEEMVQSAMKELEHA